MATLQEFAASRQTAGATGLKAFTASRNPTEWKPISVTKNVPKVTPTKTPVKVQPTNAPIKITPGAKKLPPTALEQVQNFLTSASSKVNQFIDKGLSYLPKEQEPIRIVPGQKKIDVSQMKQLEGYQTPQQESATLTQQAKQQTTQKLKDIREKFRSKSIEEVRRQLPKDYKEPGILGSMAEAFKESAVSLVSNTGASIEMVGDMTNMMLLSAAGRKIQKEADKVLAANPEWAADPLEKWGAKKVARLIVGAVPSLLAVIGATMVGGPAGATLAGFGMEAGPTYKESLQAGVEKRKAQAYGVTVGTVNGLLERIFPAELLKGSGKQALKEVGESLWKTALKKAGKFGLKVTAGGTIEGSTEAAQEMWSNIIAENYDKNRKPWNNLLESFVGGFGSGGIAGATEQSIRETLPQGENEPQTVINEVLKQKAENTEEGKALIKEAVVAQKTGEKVVIEGVQPLNIKGLDETTNAKIEELNKKDAESPAEEGKIRVYQAVEKGKTSDYVFKTPKELAQFKNNVTSPTEEFKYIDVKPEQLQAVESKPGVYQIQPSTPQGGVGDEETLYHGGRFEYKDLTAGQAFDSVIKGDKSLGSVMAEGPGIYFTSDEKEAKGYGENIQKVTPKKGINIIDENSKKLTNVQINKAISTLTKDDLYTVLSNWDEDPAIARKKLIEAIQDNKTTHDQLMSIWSDVFNRQDPDGFVAAMKVLGIDGNKIKKPKGYHMIIYNKDAFEIPKSQETKVQPKEVSVPKQQLPVGEGKEKVSRLEARMKGVMDSATEEQIQNLGLTTYQQMNKKETIAKAAEYVSTNRDDAIKVLKGDLEAPKGIPPEALYIALTQASKEDSTLITKLASLQATAIGQRLSLLTELDTDSPVKLLNEVYKIREEQAKKKYKNLKKVVDTGVENAKKEIKTVSKYDWNEFINSIDTC